MNVLVTESKADRQEWDLFAQQCNASFRCAYRATRAWQFEFHLLHKLRMFDLLLDGPEGRRKIGQCALGIGRKWRVFSDTIQLLPEFEALWPAAMQAVLEKNGPGKYIYGSEWSVEASRADSFRNIPDVAIASIKESNLEIIRFDRWKSWDDYYSSVSSNVRRNVAKSRRAGGDNLISIGNDFKHRLLLNISRYFTHKRKKIPKSFILMTVRSIFRSATVDSFTCYAVYFDREGVAAGYGGIKFGDYSFYLEGGSRRHNKGASWHLLMTMIERAWHDSEGRGAFVMGSDDRSNIGDKAWEGLVRSRHQCRVTSLPISTITFDYR